MFRCLYGKILYVTWLNMIIVPLETSISFISYPYLILLFVLPHLRNDLRSQRDVHLRFGNLRISRQTLRLLRRLPRLLRRILRHVLRVQVPLRLRGGAVQRVGGGGDRRRGLGAVPRVVRRLGDATRLRPHDPLLGRYGLREVVWGGNLVLISNIFCGWFKVPLFGNSGLCRGFIVVKEANFSWGFLEEKKKIEIFLCNNNNQIYHISHSVHLASRSLPSLEYTSRASDPGSRSSSLTCGSRGGRGMHPQILVSSPWR